MVYRVQFKLLFSTYKETLLQVGNPKCLFSHPKAKIIVYCIYLQLVHVSTRTNNTNKARNGMTPVLMNVPVMMLRMVVTVATTSKGKTIRFSWLRLHFEFSFRHSGHDDGDLI